MAEPLSEAERICLQLLEALGKPEGSGNDAELEVVRRLQDTASIISRSKKKIMVRSPEGQKLSADILRDAIVLQTAIASQSRDMSVAASLLRLENDVRKLEIYWKSFEYVTT